MLVQRSCRRWRRCLPAKSNKLLSGSAPGESARKIWKIECHTFSVWCINSLKHVFIHSSFSRSVPQISNQSTQVRRHIRPWYVVETKLEVCIGAWRVGGVGRIDRQWRKWLHQVRMIFIYRRVLLNFSVYVCARCTLITFPAIASLKVGPSKYH